MVKVVFYSARNDQGQELLEQYVRPLCKHLNMQLDVAPPGVDRGHSLAAELIKKYDIILWDASIELGDTYRAMSDWIKRTEKHVLVSRTPLPRNLLARHQCAPIHGDHFTNAMLGEWLEAWFNKYVAGNARVSSPTHFKNKRLADHYWFFDNPADLFISYRGSQLKAVKAWSERFTAETGQSVRIVPQQQYAYETECVTRQQMWEVVASLFHEMLAVKKRAIFPSDDYFSSFWTCSELFALVRSLNVVHSTVRGVYLIENHKSTALSPLVLQSPTLSIRMPTKKQENRHWRILNNSDPMTSAPDTRISPSGPAKVLAFFLKPTFGYFAPEFTGPEFWDMLRVPCPHCKPVKRKPEELDWNRYLAFEPNGTVDYFGYFAVTPEQLQTGRVQCPNCHKTIKLKNERPPRKLWIPIMTTEKDQDRPVIFDNPVWEVIE